MLKRLWSACVICLSILTNAAFILGFLVVLAYFSLPTPKVKTVETLARVSMLLLSPILLVGVYTINTWLKKVLHIGRGRSAKHT
jgi:hypothetical protein